MDNINADEMFKELGYEKEEECEYKELEDIEPTRIVIYCNIHDEEIELWNDKTVNKTITGDVGYITMQELQAINKKVEELGWINNNE